MIDVVICEQDFDVGEQYAQVCALAPRAGAVVFFVGLVRDLYDSHDSSETIEFLELEHYPGMTESLCQEIIDQARQRFPFDLARVIHRVGKIHASEQIVMVAVASRHRDNAFQAAQFIMDYLKTRATFWKKEVGVKGEQWLGRKESDLSASLRWENNSTELK
ncbi:MAG: molybdenum cofactor biosynthesis protein MoaE [Arenicella sp.]|nr:molybdenum cofactor biosynthesis protein MoaE [Arenicella sp.]